MLFINMKKGISLFFAILILSILTSTLLSLISISVSQIKVIWSMGDSVVAFYAADTGIERALYRIRQESNFEDFSGTVDGVSYEVIISSNPQEITVKSVGTNKNIKRAIEVRY